MKEPGSYPAIPAHEYRDGHIEEIAVHYARINKIVDSKQPRNRTQEDNVRTAELDFMLDLETLIKETRSTLTSWKYKSASKTEIHTESRKITET